MRDGPLVDTPEARVFWVLVELGFVRISLFGKQLNVSVQIVWCPGRKWREY